MDETSAAYNSKLNGNIRIHVHLPDPVRAAVAYLYEGADQG
jgi:hypothetical protein